MSTTYRKFNYYLYHIVFSLFVLLITLFLFLDYIQGEFDNGESLKYIIVFLTFGTFLGGCTFFSRKVCEDYHPLSLIYMVFSLIIIFIGSKALTNYVNPETKNVMDLRIPLYTLFVMEAAYLLLIKFKDDNKKTIWLIVNAVPAILSVICAFNVYSAREPAIYGFLALTIITVIIATIRCIKSCDDEIENSCLEFLGW